MSWEDRKGIEALPEAGNDGQENEWKEGTEIRPSDLQLMGSRIGNGPNIQFI